MHKINIKPISVNEAYMGRRFLTEKLKQYQRDLYLLLPKKLKIPIGKLSISYEFGFSSKASDVDNCIKVLQDVISDCYNFNDKMIYEVYAKKLIIKKGGEYIKFNIRKYSG